MTLRYRLLFRQNPEYAWEMFEAPYFSTLDEGKEYILRQRSRFEMDLLKEVLQ